MQKFRKGEKKNTIEISVIGGGFDIVHIPYQVDLSPGSYIFMKRPDIEGEILVKVRNYSNKDASVILDRFRIAGNDEVINVMKRITKGFLFENNLRDVKIVNEEFDIARGIVTFTFTADRKLKMDKVAAGLSKILHVRVEFKQIGARDLARQTGGVGICGFEICCKRFLSSLPSVTLEMAKEQFIFASPDRISGICGRLRCCLRYELEYYRELKSHFPEPGAIIETDRGPGIVKEINYVARKIILEFNDGTREEMDWVPISEEEHRGQDEEI
ncbi:MAG: regulatory iron-sulfur-containing complex subunit RicT [candidate division WOR-3 bacterium]